MRLWKSAGRKHCRPEDTVETIVTTFGNTALMCLGLRHFAQAKRCGERKDSGLNAHAGRNIVAPYFTRLFAFP